MSNYSSENGRLDQKNRNLTTRFYKICSFFLVLMIHYIQLVNVRLLTIYCIFIYSETCIALSLYLRIIHKRIEISMQEIKEDQAEDQIDSQSLEIQIQRDSEEFLAILDSKLKIRILMTLLIYPELTLSQLSEKMGKVKSTISKHMEELLTLGLVSRRERKYRSDKKQHIYSKVRKFGFRGKTYDDIKNATPTEAYSIIKQEYIVNTRLFSYILEVNKQILEYIDDFYQLEPEDITEAYIENKYRYDKPIPRFRFMTKKEYIEYTEKFIEFDDKFNKEMDQKRLKMPSDAPKEYLALHELVPIKVIMEHVLDKRKMEKEENKEIT